LYCIVSGDYAVFGVTLLTGTTSQSIRSGSSIR